MYVHLSVCTQFSVQCHVHKFICRRTQQIAQAGKDKKTAVGVTENEISPHVLRYK